MSAFVFAPDPLLTVTVEAGADGDEIHLHAGGLGFWMAQMIANLGVDGGAGRARPVEGPGPAARRRKDETRSHA